MATKIISCSFEPGSMGGFITICNGVKHSRPEHFSKTIAVTKEAFIAACKDRVLFNDILGIDIRHGWQNALAAAIQPFQTMREEFDADTAAKVSSELDVQVRGEDAVNADIAAVEQENAALEEAVQPKRGRRKKTEEPVVEEPAEPEVPAEPETPAEPEHDTTVTEDELAPSAEPVAETETPEVQAEMEKVAEEVVAAEQGQPVPQTEEPVAEEPKTEEVNDGQDPVAVADNSGEDTRSEEDSGVSSELSGSESAQ